MVEVPNASEGVGGSLGRRERRYDRGEVLSCSWTYCGTCQSQMSDDSVEYEPYNMRIVRQCRHCASIDRGRCPRYELVALERQRCSSKDRL